MTKASIRPTPLRLDEAIIAVLLTAMDANRNISAEEAARAHHMIWSMRRFRRRSGESVDRLIDAARRRLDRDGVDHVLARVARAIPARLRLPVFAAAVDVMLADTRLERAERRFIAGMAAALRVSKKDSDRVVDALVLKNSI